MFQPNMQAPTDGSDAATMPQLGMHQQQLQAPQQPPQQQQAAQQLQQEWSNEGM
jgi:hypothetical protein